MTEKTDIASVVVVSRGRPDHLTLCLLSLSQQYKPGFEVIVVADPAGIRAVERAGFAERVKLCEFDRSNISEARNLGVDLSAGRIVAFIDDDAVAEPTWLVELLAPFADADVIASTGYVRGRNGVCFQSKAQTIDTQGQTRNLSDTSDASFIPECLPGQAVKTVGTNCAFRKPVLLQVGGFDEAFRFYLEDTDLNLRLSKHGKTAIAPGAQVHHAFAASDRRRDDRVPRSLFEIGRSSAIFLRRHAPNSAPQVAWTALAQEQKARLLRHLVAGRILPGEVQRRMSELSAGWQDGHGVELETTLRPRNACSARCLPFQAASNRSAEPSLRAVRARGLARNCPPDMPAENGAPHTVLAFDMTPRPWRVRFERPGVWYHRGGLFGRVQRDAPRLSFARYRQRVAEEVRRIGKIRGLSPEAVKVL